MIFIPRVYSSTGSSLPRTHPRAKADFIAQHVKHGWSEADATARYEMWAAYAIDSNPDLDEHAHRLLADLVITKVRNATRAQD
jgi:hypothetical protein